MDVRARQEQVPGVPTPPRPIVDQIRELDDRYRESGFRRDLGVRLGELRRQAQQAATWRAPERDHPPLQSADEVRVGDRIVAHSSGDMNRNWDHEEVTVTAVDPTSGEISYTTDYGSGGSNDYWHFSRTLRDGTQSPRSPGNV